MINLIRNLFTVIGHIFKGTIKYYCWTAFLFLLMILGLFAYLFQYSEGLITTGMRDQVSWGMYISNFTFLVGVAAAAVLLVIPAYVYNFKPIKEIALFGEMLAITALVMCLLFVAVDLGQPLRGWHILPFIGRMNFPASLLAWDVIALNGYLILNSIVVLYVLITLYFGKKYNTSIVIPLVLLSIPMAVSIHTVTAFLYNGFPARPFWNASILAPRFLASAFCSGPALMIIIFQILRKVSDIKIEDRALFKIAELIAYCLAFNLFLLGAEVFKEFYSASVHLVPIEYLFFGVHGKSALVPYIWFATIGNITAFLLFLIPKTRKSFITLNIACVLVFIGVYIEKGIGLVIPGFVPDPLGDIYEYKATLSEALITIGIWAAGALLYTLMLKVAVPIYTGKLIFAAEGFEKGRLDLKNEESCVGKTE